MKNWVLRLLNISVYVVIANDTHKDKMKDCKVFLSYKKAREYHEELKPVYGNENVAFISRSVS